MASGKQKRARPKLTHKQYERRLERRRLPGPASVNIAREWPAMFGERGDSVAAVIDNTIYAPDGLNRFDAAHEAFHVMQQGFTDAQKAKLARKVGMAGPWDPPNWKAEAAPTSPHEVAADWFAAAMLGIDPGREWGHGSYAHDNPSRRQMLRFTRALERIGARNGLPGYQRPR